MPLVNVMVNSRAYTIACDDGEEEHLKQLAGYVDEKVRELMESVGQVGDARLLLMAGLLLADEVFDARAQLQASGKTSPGQVEELVVDHLESAAKRLEAIAARFAHA